TGGQVRDGVVGDRVVPRRLQDDPVRHALAAGAGHPGDDVAGNRQRHPYQRARAPPRDGGGKSVGVYAQPGPCPGAERGPADRLPERAAQCLVDPAPDQRVDRWYLAADRLLWQILRPGGGVLVGLGHRGGHGPGGQPGPGLVGPLGQGGRGVLQGRVMPMNELLLLLLKYAGLLLLGAVALVVAIILVISAFLMVLMLLQAVGLAPRVPLGYNIRNLTVRWRTTLLTGLAFTLVVGLMTVMLAWVNGMYALTKGSAVAGNVM